MYVSYRIGATTAYFEPFEDLIMFGTFLSEPNCMRL